MATSALPPSGSALPEFRIRAHNASVHSENKIHDDTVAQQYGFRGGLVPGVTVYAYMAVPVVRAFGPDWLERGAMSVRLLKPFYEGEEALVRATVVEDGPDGVTLEVVAINPAAETCAAGRATLPAVASPAPDISRFPAVPRPSPRPPVSYEELAAREILGCIDEVFDPSTGEAAQYLAEVGDDYPAHFGADAIASSGYLIRRANSALALNVALNPWIHVSSEVTHHSHLHAGEPFSTHARITELFERKGHKFVRMDVLILASGDRPVMFVDHTAIYDVRGADA
ncbi:hypothetical protein AYO38_11360 [bacterium SCGC AG-212-C10]|nr:hypothetical protein AYO38_11360 [bacterium SCGC AG-212-C10]